MKRKIDMRGVIVVKCRYCLKVIYMKVGMEPICHSCRMKLRTGEIAEKVKM